MLVILNGRILHKDNTGGQARKVRQPDHPMINQTNKAVTTGSKVEIEVEPRQFGLIEFVVKHFGLA
jgi:hypothetical protein